MRPSLPGARGRRAAVVAGLVALAAGGAAAALVGGAGGDGASPRPGRSAPARADLLDALSTLLASAATPRTGTRPTRSRDPLARRADRLPRARRVARLLLVGVAGRSPRAPGFVRLARRDWGGIVLDRANAAPPPVLAALIAGVRARARRAHGRAPLVAARQGVGPASAFPALPPPAPARLARLGPRRTRAETAAAARRLRALGLDLALAPSADVAPRAAALAAATFGDDPRAVARLARAAARGWRAGGVLSAPGHFPGQGAATQDPRLGPAGVGSPRTVLEAQDLVPFRALVPVAPAIVVSAASYAAWDGVTPATLLPEVVRGLLRGRLGFRGVVISEDLGVAAAAAGVGVGRAAVLALRAGADLLQVRGGPAEAEASYRAVLRALARGELRDAVVRDALVRVMRLERLAHRARARAAPPPPAPSAPTTTTGAAPAPAPVAVAPAAPPPPPDAPAPEPVVPSAP